MSKLERVVTGRRVRRTRWTPVDNPQVRVDLNEEGLRVERMVFPYTTRYRVQGDPRRVDAEVERVLQMYPAAGYGTYRHPPRWIAPGEVEVVIDRSNTCD